MRPLLALLGGGLLIAGVTVQAQGPPPPTGQTSNPQAASYSCDPAVCVLPACHCASTSPPGGLSPQQTPQFITFTADDAVQTYTIAAVNSFLAHRRNPNGCQPKMTHFVSLNYTNYGLVTEWYVAGNEIADHTMTHADMSEATSAAEITGNLRALNAFAGIPQAAIKGFRAPFLSYKRETLEALHEAGFTYDSSATSATPASNPDTDAFWPYTLDRGLANDCIEYPDLCGGRVSFPGLWEIPLYATFDKRGAAGIHLMDPWLDTTTEASGEVIDWLKDTFTDHYNGNRQPFGLYTHPIHLATGYPGIVDPVARIAMLNSFLDWATQHPDVWLVSNEQLLEWMRNPVPVSQMGTSAAVACRAPQVDPSVRVCNGIPANQQGLLVNCPFPEFPWQTCYGCPTFAPTLSTPVPPQNVSLGARFHLPGNCSTPFFDPVAGTCLCSAQECAFTDQTRAIGNYSGDGSAANEGGNGTTGNTSGKGAAGSGKEVGWAAVGLAAAAGVAGLVSLL